MSQSNPLTAWLHRGKDVSASFLARRALDQAINRYGRMLDFKIDSNRKTIELKVLLKGESDPVTIWLKQYQITTEPSGTFISIGQAAASREWLTTVLEDFLCGRKLPVPEKYAGMLKLFA